MYIYILYVYIICIRPKNHPVMYATIHGTDDSLTKWDRQSFHTYSSKLDRKSVKTMCMLILLFSSLLFYQGFCIGSFNPLST